MALSVETALELTKLSVFVSGLRGIGAETVKNLLTFPIKSLTIHDNQIVKVQDLGSNFLLSEADVSNKTLSQACFDKILEFNPDFPINVHTGIIDSSFLGHFDVAIFTETNKESLIQYNEICRNHSPPIGFIAGNNWGIFGMVFVDFGEGFFCDSVDGETVKEFQIERISNSDPATVTLRDWQKHNLQNGDFVRFKNLQGMTELNSIDEIEIQEVSTYEFTIPSTVSFSEYQRGGIVEKIVKPKIFEFRSFHSNLKNPQIDLNILGENEIHSRLLHYAYLSIERFIEITGNFPELLSETDFQEVFNIFKLLLIEEENCLINQELDKQLIKNICFYARTQISPIASVIGGVLAQEIVKFTHSYLPIFQFSYFDFSDIIIENVDKTPENSRYDDQIAIIGRQTHDFITSKNILLIGSGIIGCEYLRNFALMGLSKNEGEILVIDNKNLSKSNLSLNYIFKKHQYGMSKSKIASEYVKKINKELTVYSKNGEFCQDNSEMVNDQLIETQDLIICATDTVKSKLFINELCVLHEKKLIVSDTFKIDADSLICIPFISNPLQSDEIKSFLHYVHFKPHIPREIGDCIHESSLTFEKLFFEVPNVINKLFKENHKSYENITEIFTYFELTKNYLKIMKKKSIDSIIQLMTCYFNDLHNRKISNVIQRFPENKVNEYGEYFWHSPLNLPLPNPLDLNDPLYLSVITTASNFLLKVFGINEKIDHEYIQKNIEKFENFEKSHVHPEFSAKDVQSHTHFINIFIEKYKKYFEELQPIRLDIEDNIIIQFIYASSNLYAKNYKLPHINELECIFKAGYISPKFLPLSSITVGLSCLEIYKVFNQSSRENFRENSILLGKNQIARKIPKELKKNFSKEYDPIFMGPIKCLFEGFTQWDSIKIKGPCRFQEIFDKFRTEFNLDISILTINKKVIYNRYTKKYNDFDKTRYIEEEVPSKSRILSIELYVSGITDGLDYDLPLIKYIVG